MTRGKGKAMQREARGNKKVASERHMYTCMEVTDRNPLGFTTNMNNNKNFKGVILKRGFRSLDV